MIRDEGSLRAERRQLEARVKAASRNYVVNSKV
jgi:hypothetical protein